MLEELKLCEAWRLVRSLRIQNWTMTAVHSREILSKCEDITAAPGQIHKLLDSRCHALRDSSKIFVNCALPSPSVRGRGLNNDVLRSSLAAHCHKYLSPAGTYMCRARATSISTTR
eukprot:475395-Amphidinium_carterae.1